jgi:hypothetical protein
LTRGLKLEMAALVAVYEAAYTPECDRVVKRLATANDSAGSVERLGPLVTLLLTRAIFCDRDQ